MDAESAVNAGRAAGISKRAAVPPPSEPPAATPAPPSRPRAATPAPPSEPSASTTPPSSRPPTAAMTPSNGPSADATTSEQPVATNASPNGPTDNAASAENDDPVEKGGFSGNGGLARTAGPAESAAREAWAAGTADGGIVVDITANEDTEAETGNGLVGPLPGPADGPPPDRQTAHPPDRQTAHPPDRQTAQMTVPRRGWRRVRCRRFMTWPGRRGYRSHRCRGCSTGGATRGRRPGTACCRPCLSWASSQTARRGH